MTSTLTLDPHAAGQLAERVDGSGALLGSRVQRLGGGLTAPGDPWRVDAALSAVTDVARARLLAIASDLIFTADALRSAVGSYRAADDRSAARLGALARNPRPAPLGERPW